MAKREFIVCHGLRFTAREWQIAERIAKGMLIKQIAQDLKLREGTIKIYLSNLYARMRAYVPEQDAGSLRIILAEWVHCQQCKTGEKS